MESGRAQRAQAPAAIVHQPAGNVTLPTASALPASPVGVPSGSTRWIEAGGRHGLAVIRAAIGVVFVACGASSLLKLAPVDPVAMQHGALALGGAALVAGALLPLLKGIEVLIEVTLDRVSAPTRERK